MEQNTNAQGKGFHPLRVQDTGTLINNQIKYYNNLEDKKEAQRRIAQARQQEFEFKLNKEANQLVKPFNDIDARGYFIAETQKYKNSKRKLIANLGLRASNFDVDAKIKLNQELDKFKHIVNASDTVKKQAEKLAGQIAKEEFNPFRDNGLLELQKSMAEGRYVLDEKLGKFRVYNQKGDKVIAEFDPQDLKNKYLNLGFHKPPTFNTNAENIAKNILDTDNGQKLITPNTKLRATELINSYLSANENDRISFYNKARQEGLIGDKPLDNYNIADLSALSGLFYETEVKSRISQEFDSTKQKKDALELANKEQSLINKKLEAQSKRNAIKKAKKEDNQVGNTVQPSKTPTGELESINDIFGEFSEDAKLFTLSEPLTITRNGQKVEVNRYVIDKDKLSYLGEVEQKGTGADKTVKFTPVTIADTNDVDELTRKVKSGKGKVDKNGKSQGTFKSKEDLVKFSLGLTEGKEKSTSKEIVPFDVWVKRNENKGKTITDYLKRN